MSYIDRLNKRAKEWKEAKITSGFEIPRGDYVVEIDKIEIIEESKADFKSEANVLGTLEIQLGGIILHGPQKGKKVRASYWPEQAEHERNGKHYDSGQAVFKALLNKLGVWTTDKPLPWEQLDKVMLKLRGVTANFWAKGNGNNGYLNSRVDPDEMVSGSDDDVEAPSADIDFDDDEEFKIE